MCDCIARINELLKPHNTEISIGLSFATGEATPPMVVTCKADFAQRGKPKSLFASFCPFCGESLSKATPTPEASEASRGR